MVMPWLVCTVNHSFGYFTPAHGEVAMEVSPPSPLSQALKCCKIGFMSHFQLPE